jgi:uncharacterized protein involved in oxidation of intracellular sulfur
LMVNAVIRQGKVLLCGTCMDARGLTDEEVATGAKRSTMNELAEVTLDADKVLVFRKAIFVHGSSKYPASAC